MTWAGTLQEIATRDVWVGLPELLLVFVVIVFATIMVTLRVFPQHFQNSVESKLLDHKDGSTKYKLFADGLGTPTFVVTDGFVVFSNSASKGIPDAKDLSAKAVEMAINMPSDSLQVHSNVVEVGISRYQYRAISFTKSTVVVIFVEVTPEQTRYVKLLKSVSHEINKDIGIIHGNAGTASDFMDDILSESDRDSRLEFVKDSTERIVARANKLLELVERQNKLASMRDPTFLETTKFAEINMMHLVDTCIKPIEENDVPVYKQFSPGLPLVMGNKGLLERVFDNLLDNAVKYSGDPKEVKVVLGEADRRGYVSCAVVDNGKGIAEEYHDEIFSDGFRIIEETEQYVKGWGFGLAEVKRIVDLHDGYVSLESIEGEGSIFTVEIPCVE